MSAGVSVGLFRPATAGGGSRRLLLDGLGLLGFSQPPGAHGAALEISLIQFNHSSVEKKEKTVSHFFLANSKKSLQCHLKPLLHILVSLFIQAKRMLGFPREQNATFALVKTLAHINSLRA